MAVMQYISQKLSENHEMGVFDAHSIYLERFWKMEFFSRNLISGIWQMLKLVRYQIPDFQYQTKFSPNFAKNGQICVFGAHWAYPDRFSKFEYFSKNLHFSWFWLVLDENFEKKIFPIFSISLCGSIMSSHKSPNLKYHLNWSIKS